MENEREIWKMTMMQHATHMLHCLFISSVLFDNATCNPHAVSPYFFSSVLFDDFFPQCCLIMQHTTHMLCCLFLFLSVV